MLLKTLVLALGVWIASEDQAPPVKCKKTADCDQSGAKQICKDGSCQPEKPPPPPKYPPPPT